MITEEMKQIFYESCLKHGIHDQKTIEDVTRAGSKQFVINSAGHVVAHGEFQYIGEFVAAFKTSQPRQGVPLKQQLYGKMIHLAETGNMAAYRRVRKEYAAL